LRDDRYGCCSKDRIAKPVQVNFMRRQTAKAVRIAIAGKRFRMYDGRSVNVVPVAPDRQFL
jgi:hypothetical protein